MVIIAVYDPKLNFPISTLFKFGKKSWSRNMCRKNRLICHFGPFYSECKFLSPMDQQLVVCKGLLIVTASPSHSHTTLTTDRHAPCGIRTRNLSKRAATDPRLRPRGRQPGQGVQIRSWISIIIFVFFFLGDESTKWRQETATRDVHLPFKLWN